MGISLQESRSRFLIPINSPDLSKKMYPPAYKPITLAESAWPRVRNMPILPTGLSKGAAWANHSMANLLTDWHAGMRGTVKHHQIIAHRGVELLFAGVPDNSPAALELATAGLHRNCGNNAECDLIFTKGSAGQDAHEPLIQHDKVADRQTTATGLWEEFIVETNDPLPLFILRDPGTGAMSSRYIDTLNKVPKAFHFLRHLIERNKNTNLIFDCRDDDSAKVAASFSKYTDLHKHAAIQLYGYTIQNFLVFEQKVLVHGPSEGWKNIFYILVMMPDVLGRLAGVDEDSCAYDSMFAGAQIWINSMFEGGLKIVALSFGAVGVGFGVNLDTMEVHDLNGRQVIETRVKSAFIKDRVLLDLLIWAKQTYSEYPTIGLSMTYGFRMNGKYYVPAFHTGKPTEMATGQLAQIWQLRAIPGNPFRLGFDWAICDRVFDNLNYLLGTKTYFWPEGIDNVERNIEKLA